MNPVEAVVKFMSASFFEQYCNFHLLIYQISILDISQQKKEKQVEQNVMVIY